MNLRDAIRVMPSKNTPFTGLAFPGQDFTTDCTVGDSNSWVGTLYTSNLLQMSSCAPTGRLWVEEACVPYFSILSLGVNW